MEEGHTLSEGKCILPYCSAKFSKKKFVTSLCATPSGNLPTTD